MASTAIRKGRRMLASQMRIDSHTAVYGILGNPVRHSLSPQLHTALFGRLKMNAVYLVFQAEREALGLAFEGLKSLGIRGVNVTLPFKEDALNFVDEVPEDADRCVGAVNTVVNQNGKLIGFNTDGAGFLMALETELGFKPKGKTILLLGAGGAARAVLFALARSQAETVLMYNRTLARAQGLKEYAAGYFPKTGIDVLTEPGACRAKKIDLVVNATSCGMAKEDPVWFDLRLLSAKPCVYDLVYSPPKTKLLAAAQKMGLPHANGLGMLAAQAALSFQLWTGRRQGVREAMLKTLKKCSL